MSELYTVLGIEVTPDIDVPDYRFFVDDSCWSWSGEFYDILKNSKNGILMSKEEAEDVERSMSNRFSPKTYQFFIIKVSA